MEQSASATLYPKRIIIATRIGNKYGGWLTTDRMSILPSDISNEELGTVTLRHILLSEIKEFTSEEAWDCRARYKSLANFKTEGQLMKDSKLAMMILNDNVLRFEPKNNKYSQVRRHHYEYYGMPDHKFDIDYPCSPKDIGVGLRKAWDLALIT